MAATAAVLHHVDDQHRDGDFLTTDTTRVSSSSYAVTVDEIDLDGLEGDWLLGTARLRATGTDPGSSVFIGVGLSADVEAYLREAAHSRVTDIDDGNVTYDQHAGGQPSVAPGDSDLWVASASGTGTQTVTWEPQDGDWTVVVMNQDASAGVDVDADVGATVPILARAVHWLVAGSALSGAAGALVVFFMVASSRRRRTGRALS